MTDNAGIQNAQLIRERTDNAGIQNREVQEWRQMEEQDEVKKWRQMEE